MLVIKVGYETGAVATTLCTYITHPLTHADKHNCTPTFWSKVVTSCWLVEESRNPCILAFSGSSCNTHTYCTDSYRIIVEYTHKLQCCFSLTAATHACTVIMHTRRDRYRSPCYIALLRMLPVRRCSNELMIGRYIVKRVYVLKLHYCSLSVLAVLYLPFQCQCRSTSSSFHQVHQG